LATSNFSCEDTKESSAKFFHLGDPRHVNYKSSYALDMEIMRQFTYHNDSDNLIGSASILAQLTTSWSESPDPS